MLNIVKAEFKKFFRGKLFIATIILIIAFPLLSGILYGLVQNKVSGNMFGITAEFAFLSSFSPLNNLGLILLIFIQIILISDFSQNTIRNKIIAGYCKHKIYLSSTIFTLTISVVSTTVYALLTYLFTGIFISFSELNIAFLIEHLVVGILATMAIYAFVQLVVFIFKSLGATLGTVLGSFLGTFLIYNILTMSMSVTAQRIVMVIVPLLHFSYFTEYQDLDMLWMVLSSIGFTAGAIGLGLFLNKKLDYR